MRDQNLNKPIANRSFEKEYKIVITNSDLPGESYTNKTETRVKLEFHVKDSLLLSEEEKETILIKLKRRINDEGYLQVFADEYKEQARNRQLAQKRFYSYLTNALKKKKSISAKHIEKKTEKRNPPSGQAGKRRRKSPIQKITYKGSDH